MRRRDWIGVVAAGLVLAGCSSVDQPTDEEASEAIYNSKGVKFTRMIMACAIFGEPTPEQKATCDAARKKDRDGFKVRLDKCEKAVGGSTPPGAVSCAGTLQRTPDIDPSPAAFMFYKVENRWVGDLTR